MGLLSILGLSKPGLRVDIPGGPGSVVIPAPYDPFPPGDYRYRETGALTAYRRYHSTMGGYNESNGAIAVARPTDFKDLADFVRHARGALTSRWSVAHESEGHWYGRPEKFPERPEEGSNGPERIGMLSVHMIGWRVYDAPGALYAVHDKRGVMIAIWIFNRDGGEKRARRLAEGIAASYEP
jgi:hypothetical protein